MPEPRTGGDRPHGLGRRRLGGLAAAAVAGAVIWLASAQVAAAPIGYWRSAESKSVYVAAYTQALGRGPAPTQTLDVRTGYGVVRLYRYAGANPSAAPFVLLPGTASGSPVWVDNLPSLLTHRDVWTVDLLGEPGLSVQEMPLRDADDQAAWLDEALAQLPTPRVHLVGMSFGGWTATNVALRRPTHVASVSLLDPVLVFSDLRLEVIIRSIPASVPWLPKAWRDDFASWTAGGAPVRDDPVARMIEAGMQGYRLGSPTPARPPESELSSLSVPVLAIFGGRSPMHDSADAAATARRLLPRARVEVYPQATHAINGEFPDRVAADIGRFTSTTDPR